MIVALKHQRKRPSGIRGYTEIDDGLESGEREAIRLAVDRSFSHGVEFQCRDGRQRNCDEILDGCLHLIFAHEQGSLESDQIIGEGPEDYAGTLESRCRLGNESDSGTVCGKVEGLRDRVGFEKTLRIEFQSQQVVDNLVVEQRVGVPGNPDERFVR
jgi:hypothetical protein